MRKFQPAGFRAVSVIAFAAVALAACGGTSNQPVATPTPSPTPKPVVEFKDAGTQGKVLVATKNGMTLYTFMRDTANSGKSNCTGPCIQRWPALTVDTGAKPTGATGVTGILAAFVRTDDQTTQVTYNGLPLYFFSEDKAAGDTKGIYQNWAVVKP